ncbi:hypothetical protein HNQ36_000516 [Afipia massiliensis]|uniref:Uncharacterized protein n=1 Tax=Afipia massiliensis TaxID=211460 RepID=A0A840MXX2_9BRAD|nr:hypothetical protein [Afipia massiliensis]MBB5050568.1 hypothetical protein [Afipia massiliensis]
MTPQESVLDAVLRARGILAEYIEPGPRDCAQTLSRLFVIFDDEKLTTAINILSLEAVSAAMAEADTTKRSPASPRRRRTTG